MKNIVMVDDEQSIFKLINAYSSEFNFFYAKNLNELTGLLLKERVDLIIMDNYLDEESGIENSKVVKENKNHKNIPIIMFSGEDGEEAITKALDVGVDDYVSKSNSLKLLKAKISANLRKFSNRDTKNEKNIKKIELLEQESSIRFKDTKIILSKKEFLIMKALTENPNKCFSRKELNSISSGDDIHVSDRSIDTFIAYLREKLKSDSMIQTIRGQGYKINLES